MKIKLSKTQKILGDFVFLAILMTSPALHAQQSNDIANEALSSERQILMAERRANSAERREARRAELEANPELRRQLTFSERPGRPHAEPPNPRRNAHHVRHQRRMYNARHQHHRIHPRRRFNTAS